MWFDSYAFSHWYGMFSSSVFCVMNFIEQTNSIFDVFILMFDSYEKDQIGNSNGV